MAGAHFNYVGCNILRAALVKEVVNEGMTWTAKHCLNIFVDAVDFDYYRCTVACAKRTDFAKCFAECLAKAHAERRAPPPE